jgi:3-deoxy-D-arabino-heptulosonate 7-phosphate (DAHP) synthase
MATDAIRTGQTTQHSVCNTKKAPLQLMECHLNQQMHSILRCALSVLTPNKQYSILYRYHRALVYAVLVL